MAGFEGEWLFLSGLQKLTDQQAQYLASSTVERLYLRGLQKLTHQQAEYLANFQGKISIKDGLKEKIKKYKKI